MVASSGPPSALHPSPGRVRRIWVLGTSGSGKTHFARRASATLAIPHVELDSLQHGPGWAQATPGELLERATAALAGDAWVVDGNYPTARNALMHRAELVVWLDPSRPLLMARVIRRTAGRLVLRRRLWNGNRERLRNLADRDHPVWWAWRTHHRRRRDFAALMDQRWARLRRRGEDDLLLRRLGGPADP